ncbi:hypothetical protein FZC74_18800 [Sutcliffiella horikoshii]|uniref:Uncharacterized protein n=1 Tax=Sutcliffiella horikoshii TaxID=79883 RepID=A0AA94WKX6_9BACI|nr:hypothetical protein [Sutcliffiella horikoshii]TYS55569.1 hypothetical protein FZC74_18800 [Sutcliffiella horikoshii]
MVRKKRMKSKGIFMKGSLKSLAVLCGLTILLAGCNMFAQTDPDPEFTISSTSVGMGGNELETVQYVRYSMILTYNDSLKIAEDTVEPLLAGWLEERMLDHEIELAEEIGKGQFKLEGKVTFDPNGLSKVDMVKLEEQEETVQGVLFETAAGDYYQAAIIDSETKLTKIGE